MHRPRPAPYLVLWMSYFVILANFTLASPEKPPKCAVTPATDYTAEGYRVDCSHVRTLFVSPYLLLFNISVSPVFEIDLSGNGMGDIRATSFIRFPTLKRLVVDDNAISTYALIATGLRQLLYLSIQQNSLTRIGENSLIGLPKLITLNLSENKIAFIANAAFNGLDGLVNLYLNGNKLLGLTRETLSFLPGLKMLDLNNNHMPKIDQDMLAASLQLEELHCAHNLIQTIEPGAFSNATRLQLLSLPSNRLGHLDWSWTNGLQTLEKLTLSLNGLSELNVTVLRRMTRLQSLILHSNNIERVHADGNISMPQLRLLDISHNPLRVLPFGWLRSFTGLDHLSLKEIKSLQDLPDVEGLIHLQTLDIEGTSIPTIDGCEMDRMPQLRVIHWQGSPIQCDCRLMKFVRWYREHKPSEGSSLLCATPSELRGHALIALKDHRVCKATLNETSNSCRRRDTTSAIPYSKSDQESELLTSTLEPDPSGESRPATEITLHLTAVAIHMSSIGVRWSLATNHPEEEWLFTLHHQAENSSRKVLDTVTRGKNSAILTGLKPRTLYNICLQAYRDVNKAMAETTACIKISTNTQEFFIICLVPSVGIVLLGAAAAIIIALKRRSSARLSFGSRSQHVETEAVPCQLCINPVVSSNPGTTVSDNAPQAMPPTFDEAMAMAVNREQTAAEAECRKANESESSF